MRRRLATLLVCAAAVAGLTGQAFAGQAGQTWEHGEQLWGSKSKITWTDRTVRITGTGWDRSVGASTLITFEGLSGAEDAHVDGKTRHIDQGNEPLDLTLGRGAERTVDAVRITTFQRGIGMAYSYTVFRRS